MPNRRRIGAVSTLIVVAASLAVVPEHANADIQTTLTFATPSSIRAGGSVTVDLNVNFLPLAATTGAPSFIDNSTGNGIQSCAADPNACTELQFDTTASALVSPGSVFSQILAFTTAAQTVPMFYSFSGVGTFPITFTYPDAGRYEITTAGPSEQEQFSELECQTPWNHGVADGSATCSSIQTFDVTDNFNPQGTPDVYVTVNTATSVSEPPSLLLLGASLLAAGFVTRRKKPSRIRFSL